jgi:AP2-associated kinase
MILSDREQISKAEKEARIWKKLSPHASIVEFIDSELVEKDGRFEMLILCELCEGGFTLVDMIQACKGQL